MVKLSAFADEVTSDFAGQVEFLVKHQIRFIELRFLDQKNVMNISSSELSLAKKMLDDNGISVSAIGSPIGKVGIDQLFAPHFEKFKHAADLALFFGTSLIRIFSYYPPQGSNIADYRSIVIDRMAAKVEYIAKMPITLVHENESGIYGDTAQRCVDLAKAVDSSKFRLAYDPANFVSNEGVTDSIKSCWPIMQPYIAHVHIKDWEKGRDIGSMPGSGDGNIKELLVELAQIDYHGFMTMEPHLQKGGQFGGSTGKELFAEAINCVKGMAIGAGITIS